MATDTEKKLIFKMCPKCNRVFAPHFIRCPFDDTALQSVYKKN